MKIFVNRSGQQTGPFSLEEVRSQLGARAITLSDLAWYEGAAGWMPLSAVPGVVGAAPAPPVMQGGVAGPVGSFGARPETSSLAITSLVLGILAFFSLGLTGIPAAICGHIARARIKRSGGALSGQGLALGGLIAGYVGFFFNAVFILLGIGMVIFSSVQDKAAATKCLSEAKQIGLACKLYAGDHDGNYPPTLEQLTPTYLADDHLLAGLKKKDEAAQGYEYFGGKDSDPPKTVLLRSRGATDQHQRVTVYSDNSAELVRE